MDIIIGDLEGLEGHVEDDDDGFNAPDNLIIKSAAGELIIVGDFVRKVKKYFKDNKEDIMEAKRMVYIPPRPLGNGCWVIELVLDPEYPNRVGGAIPNRTPFLFEGADFSHGDMENTVFMLRIYCVGEYESGPIQDAFWEYRLQMCRSKTHKQPLHKVGYSTSGH